jgi:hydrogenase/urease accessory protein HupE
MALVIFLALLSHDEKVVSAELRVDGDRVELRLHVGMERISKGVKLPVEPIELTELQLERVKGDVAAYILSRTKLTIDGAAPRLELAALEPRFEKFLATGEEFIASVVATFQAAGRPSTSIGFSYDAFVEYPDSKVLVTAAWGEGRRTYVRMGPDLLEIRGSDLNPTAWQTASEFLLWGMHHIFIGFDHIAFLLALLLGASKAMEMVKIVTSFTVAHSLTLILAVLVVEKLPVRLIEIAIAATIVYVALENLWARSTRHRWMLTFVFGLIHGFGFANVLREMSLPTTGLVRCLLSFNLGVELGQLAIVLAFLPVAWWLGKWRHGRKVIVAFSVLLALFGAAWFIERVFLLEFMPF